MKGMAAAIEDDQSETGTVSVLLTNVHDGSSTEHHLDKRTVTILGQARSQGMHMKEKQEPSLSESLQALTDP